MQSLEMFQFYQQCLYQACNKNFGPGKNGPGGPFWSPKIGPGGPTLVAKIGPAQPKMVWCRIYSYHASAASDVRPHFRYKCAAVSRDAL